MSNYDSDQFDEMAVLSEIQEVSVPSLSVVVDFNDLMATQSLVDAYRIVTTLKDLLS